MNIDLNTLTMVASVITLLQVMALFVQWQLDKTYRGPGWWLLGMAATGLGFAWAYLRAVPQWVLLAIVGNNLSFVFGRTFMYIGILRFLGRRERRGALIAFLAVFSLVDIYFTYFNNDIVVRRAIFNLTIAVLSFLGGRAAYLYKTRAVTTSATLLSATFVLNGLVFVVSLLFNVFTPPDAGPLIASVSQLVSILGGLIATMLTTFGFILLINQRLNAESREAKSNLELIFNVQPDATVLTRLRDGLVIRVNDGFTAMTGYTRAEIAGKSMRDVNLWKNLEERQKLITALHENGHYSNQEAVFQRRDGSEFFTMSSGKVLLLNGEPHSLSLSRDITEKKRAEEALRESEAKHRVLFQNSPDAYLIIADGHFVDCNRATEIMLRGDRTQIVGKAPDALSPEFQPDGRKSSEAAAENIRIAFVLGSTTFEWMHRRLDGTDFLVDVSVAAITLERKPALFITWRDITARKQAEDALRETNAYLENLINYANAPIIVWDPRFCITRFNHAFEFLTGRREAEVVGQSLELLFPPELVDPSMAQIRKTLTGERWETVEIKIQHRDGAVWTLLWNSATLFAPDGLTPLATIAQGQDITARKQAEDALRASEQRLNDVIANNVDGLLVLDQTHCVVFANPAAANLLHKSESELLNTEFGFVLTGHPIEVDLCQNQTHTILEMRAVDIVWNGLPAQLATLHDVTARKLAEEALHDLNLTLEQRVADRTAELQAANVRLTELDHLKDEFLSRISHELRTPLTNVKIYIELLETGKPEKRDKYVQTLKREADKLHALIEEVLMFSQLNLNTAPSTLATIDLTALIAGRLANWQKLSAGHALEFRLNLALDLPPARADSELIIHALNRLIANAVNYTPAGSVTISTARVVEAERTWVTLSVTDTGPGITPEDLPHIFERFYRGRAAADYKTPGAGIGLSISREIAERLGGCLTVDTQVGAGTTFTLWLPASPTAG